MRAIDADALQLAIVEEGQANKRKKYIVGDIWELTGAEIREVINSQPTIQPEPKRGKWIEDEGQQTLMQNFIERGEVWRVCSVCGAGHMIGHKYAIDKAYHDRHHNYCPNCGADMRKVNHEQMLIMRSRDQMDKNDIREVDAG